MSNQGESEKGRAENIIQMWISELQNPDRTERTLTDVCGYLKLKENRVKMRGLIPTVVSLVESCKNKSLVVDALALFCDDNEANAMAIAQNGKKLTDLLWQLIREGSTVEKYKSFHFIAIFCQNKKEIRRSLFLIGFVELITSIVVCEFEQFRSGKKKANEYILYFGMNALAKLCAYKRARPKFLKKGGLNLLYTLVKERPSSYVFSVTLDCLEQVHELICVEYSRLFILYLGRYLDAPSDEWLDSLINVLILLDIGTQCRSLFELGVAQKLVQLLGKEEINSYIILNRFCDVTNEKPAIGKKFIQLGVLRYLVRNVFKKSIYNAIGIRFLGTLVSLKQKNINVCIASLEPLVNCITKAIETTRDFDCKKNGLAIFGHLCTNTETVGVLINYKSVINTFAKEILQQLSLMDQKGISFMDQVKIDRELQSRIAYPVSLICKNIDKREQVKKITKILKCIPKMIESGSQTFEFFGISALLSLCDKFDHVKANFLPTCYSPLVTCFNDNMHNRFQCLKLLSMNFESDDNLVDGLKNSRLFLFNLRNMMETNEVKYALKFFQDEEDLECLDTD